VIAVIATYEETGTKEDRKLGNLETVARYYMKQTKKLDNACGLIACLHGIYNNLDKIELIPESILDRYFKSASP
jgi:hypothetical protein